MAKIGFIGLGHMGLPMACNLVKAGHSVTGYDLQALALNQFKAANGLIAASLSDAIRFQEIIITVLQTSEQVMDICQARNGLLEEAAKETLFIDCSTIDVDTARQVHQLADEHHLLALDAPVSGGVLGAKAASLTFMVGGAETTFTQALPILTTMGKKIIHTGGPGSGQAAKICNNMILGISMIAVSEAFLLGKALQLAPEKLFEVASNSSGQCWAMTHYVPVPGILDNVPANNEYKPGFAALMMLKDLILGQEAAHRLHVKTALGAKATELYQTFVSEGFGELDFSAIIQGLANQ